ncbi:MAG: hypothetical protein PHZ07_00700 [Patescibacteria group bacterium]|nr:hypothetical protein [Patescibacteria group bacterium]MDD4304788.1 hypothetical protein [Patescibacteria group bacterium]MDD4695273.1 hypothetical protein [Patescibacteria group bacterium]
MKSFMFLIVVMLALFMFGCEDITRVSIHDDNQDGVYHWGPGDVVGNVAMDFHPAIENTPAYSVVHNLSPVAIGYDVRKRDDASFICFADSYIGGNDYSIQQGNLPLDEWLKVRLVVYKSGLLGGVVVVIQALGLDFFDSLKSYMIDSVYEAEFILISDDGLKWSDIWSGLHWKKILKEEFFKK